MQEADIIIYCICWLKHCRVQKKGSSSVARTDRPRRSSPLLSTASVKERKHLYIHSLRLVVQREAVTISEPQVIKAISRLGQQGKFAVVADVDRGIIFI